MSIQVQIKDVPGLKLTMRTAHKVDREQGGLVASGTDWRSEPHPVEQDEDTRRRDINGGPLKAGTYTAYIVAGLKQLLIERAGPRVMLDFRNGALRNQMRVSYQVQESKKDKQGKVSKDWVAYGTPQYFAPTTFVGATVGDGMRAIVEEMPT